MTAQIPPLEEMVRQLVATPSVSSVNPQHDSSNLAVLELLAEWLEALGFSVEISPLADRPGKANLVATLGSGSGGLVLSGHSDTVPCDAKRWKSDPFELVERDGRLYGLGTADMKSFFAVALTAVRQIIDRPPREPLMVVATADEECGMHGARALLAADQPKARYALIGEATELRPINAHKGILMQAVELLGKAGHSSDPGLGVNALDDMHAVVGELMRWREELRASYHDNRFAVPYPTLNLGALHGGDNPNRICDSCELQFDLRPLPGMETRELHEQLAERLSKRLHDSDVVLQIRSLAEDVPPLATPNSSPLVQLTQVLTGHRAETVGYATEGPFFQQLGMDAVVLGPGSIAQAHQPNEFVSRAQLEQGVRLYADLIAKLCLQKELAGASDS